MPLRPRDAAAKERRTTAIHEAAHAVAAIAIGVHEPETMIATIRSSADSLGVLTHQGLRISAAKLRAANPVTVLNYLNNRLAVDLAGYVAEQEWAGQEFGLRACFESARDFERGHDIREAMDAVAHVARAVRPGLSRPRVSEIAIEACMVFSNRARRFLSHADVRRAGMRVARQLLQRETLDGEALLGLTRHAKWSARARKAPWLSRPEVRVVGPLLYG